MANLKDIKRRIGSVKNTQQITKAMKLVAAAKLRRAQEAVMAARPYAEKMIEVTEHLVSKCQDGAHPLMVKREVKKVLILIIAGDKGLCGPFNSNVFKAALKVIEEHEGKEISLVVVGKKGVDFFKRRHIPIRESFLDYGKRLTNIGLAHGIASVMVDAFMEKKADEALLVYNRFKNVVVQEPRTLHLLPMTVSKPHQEGMEESAALEDYEYEPSAEELLGEILERCLETQIYQALLESSASENGARMTAMDAASKNAREMIDGLTLAYNRARQAAITTEIIEVVTGADALSG